MEFEGHGFCSSANVALNRRIILDFDFDLKARAENVCVGANRGFRAVLMYLTTDGIRAEVSGLRVIVWGIFQIGAIHH